MNNVDIDKLRKDLEDKLIESKQIEESLNQLEDNKSTMEENDYNLQKDNLSNDLNQVKEDIKEMTSTIEAYNIIKADLDVLEQLSKPETEEEVENFNKKQEAIKKEIKDNQHVVNQFMLKDFAKEINRINKVREAQKENESISLENNNNSVEQVEEINEKQVLKQLSEEEMKISDEEKKELDDFENKAAEEIEEITPELEELNKMLEEFKNRDSDIKLGENTEPVVDVKPVENTATDQKEEITSDVQEPQQEEPALTEEEAIVANIRDKMGAINATNYFLQDSDKINLAIFEKALETKNVADINNALAYAEELKLKNIPGYSPILNDKLNELLEISKSKTPDQVVTSTEDEKTTVASNTTDEELRNRPTTPYLGPNDSIFIDESRIDKEHSYLSASNASNLGYLDKEEEKQDSLTNSTPIKKINPIKEKLWLQVEERRNKRLRKKDSNVIEFTYDDEEVKEEEKAHTKTLNMSAFTSISIMAITTTVMSIGIIVLGLMVLK